MRDRRVFLFLQGPISPFFARVAERLERLGHRTVRVNLCVGDWLFWRRPGARNFRGGIESWPGYIADLMDREGVTDLLLLGEQRDHHRIAIELARERGIAITVTDFGYLRPDFITLESNGMTGESLFPRDPDGIRALAERAPEPNLKRLYPDSFRRMASWDVLYHLANSFLWMFYPHYQSNQLYHPVPAYLGTGLRLLLARRRARAADALVDKVQAAKTRYYVFPLQMATDFSIRAYSDFPDLATAIRKVIGSFAANAPEDSRLLIKVHPYDPGLVSWQRLIRRESQALGCAGRVSYLDGGQLDRMLSGCDGLVTINSTTGLRGLQLDCPVIVLGQAIYDVPGLTYQNGLDRFWTEAPPPNSALRDDFVKALLASIQLRGVFYADPGLEAAVTATVERLDLGLVNQPVAQPVRTPDAALSGAAA